jgi:hypothetical protein
MSARMLGSYCLGLVRSQGSNANAARYAREQMTIDIEGAEFWRTVACYLEAV